jgi:hypothetical protein
MPPCEVQQQQQVAVSWIDCSGSCAGSHVRLIGSLQLLLLVHAAARQLLIVRPRLAVDAYVAAHY